VWLGPGFVVTASSLHDEPLGARHPLHHSILPVLGALRKGCTFGQLVAIAKDTGIEEGQLMAACGFLNSIGALRRRRGLRQRLRAATVIMRHKLLGISYGRLRYRHQASVGVLCSELIMACGPVCVASLLSATLIAGSGLLEPIRVTVLVVYGNLLLLASLTAHELAHVRLLSRWQRRSVLLRNGMRFGVLHQELSADATRLVALGGPAAGITVCLTAGWLLWTIGATGLAVASLVTASFHAGSLLPWYADGAAVFRSGRAEPLKRPY
jgi:hypothetical protein